MTRPTTIASAYRRQLAVVTAGALAALLPLGCSSVSSDADSAPSASAQTTTRYEVTVFAAASLTGPFDDIAKAYDGENPGSRTTVQYDGSPTLAEQITQGAPADVFAPADAASLKTVADAGLVVGEPVPYVENTLTIAVAPGNPTSIEGIADLARPDVDVAVCAPEVPCGVLAHKAFDRAGIDVRPTTEELNVKAVLGRVTDGEVDAGLVYVTDVKGSNGTVEGVALADGDYTTYYLAVVGGANPAATRFIEFVRSPRGMDILTKYGFVAARDAST